MHCASFYIFFNTEECISFHFLTTRNNYIIPTFSFYGLSLASISPVTTFLYYESAPEGGESYCQSSAFLWLHAPHSLYTPPIPPTKILENIHILLASDVTGGIRETEVPQSHVVSKVNIEM